MPRAAAQSHDALHRRARERGVNPILYWLVRGVLQPAFHVYFRLSRIGREHIPQSGPVIFAANHRSFLDPFVIATMARRPLYYVAKQELFRNRLQGWLLNSLGAFPVNRGNGDRDTIATATAILARGDAVLIFPEGTRVRPGPPGRPKRGVGRLALETGAPVVPVAVIGTTDVRKGWRIRPRKVRIRAGRALTFPRVADPSRELAAAVTERIWPCVMLQWEWLGGATPLRRAVVVGAEAQGTALAVALARAGLDVDLGTRSREQAEELLHARREVLGAGASGPLAPDRIRIAPAADLELGTHDLVCLALPAGDLPAALDAYGTRIPPRAGVLVVSDDDGDADAPAPSLGALPPVYAGARAVAATRRDAAVLLSTRDDAFARELAAALGSAGYDLRSVGEADPPAREARAA